MGSIYLLQNNDALVEMSEQQYDSERLLQELIAKYPNLLAGDQMAGESPRRWLLVSRELALATEQDGGGRWSVDHLFLDKDAIPTLVEVKRSGDTRIRREVVGQMLDYAANGVVYWPIEEIRAKFESNCENQDMDADQVLDGFLGPDASRDDFWQRVKTNLQAGRVRMVFVADEIPAELRHVVEFLNTQMDPAEVLALEIKQFVGQNLKTLVPRVMGQTAEAQQRKAPTAQGGRQWDEASFFKALETKRGPAEANAARAITEWARSRMPRFWFGHGTQDGSFSPILDYKGVPNWFFVVYTYGRVEIQFQHMRNKPPFDDDAKRLEMIRRLNQVPGVEIPENALNRRPSMALAALTDDAARRQFLGVLEWGLTQVSGN